MSVRIDVRPDLTQAKKKLSLIQRSIVPSATRWAINEAAKAVAADEMKEIQRVFDRPTSYTLRGVRLRYAGQDRLEAVVWLKDDWAQSNGGAPAGRYLLPHIEGGGRALKAFERRLQHIGVMPTGTMAVPGAGAELDAYGNMRRGQIVQILSYFSAFWESGSAGNMKGKDRARLAKGSPKRGVRGVSYFVSRGISNHTSHLPMGIWSRTGFGFGTAIKPVLLFVRAPVYRKRFDFYGVAHKAVARVLRPEFEKAMASLLKSRGLA